MGADVTEMTSLVLCKLVALQEVCLGGHVHRYW